MEEFEDVKKLATSEKGSLLLQLIKVSFFTISIHIQIAQTLVLLLNFANLRKLPSVAR